jgi:outer membrane protein insertion porin family
MTKGVFIAFFFLLLTFFFAETCPAYSKYYKKTINNIHIEAEPFIDKKEMLRLLDIKPGDLYSEKLIQEGMKMLFLKNFFSNIIVEAEEINGKVDLAFTLVPKIKIKEIDFKGHDYFWKSDLKRIISAKVGAEFNEKRAVQSVERLERYYKDEGFLNVSVEYEVEQRENQYEIGVIFNIDEGEPAEVESITFDFPNVKFDEEEIKDVIDIQPGDRFSKNIIKEAQANLEEYLIENGYYDLDKIRFDYKEEPKIDLKITVEIRSRVIINFIGNEEYSDKKLFSFFNFIKHKSSELKVIKNFVDDIISFYVDNGFYFARITIDDYGDEEKEEPDAGNGEKVINIRVFEGKRVKVKEIKFTGNSRYDDKRLTEQMLTRECGIYFDEYLIKNVFDEDINALTFLYQKDGYLDVEIEHEKIFNEEKSEVILEIEINEGEVTTISEILLEGVSTEYINDVRKIIKSEENKAINIYRVEDEKNEIINFYKRNGFYNVKVETKSKFLSYDKIQITYSVKEGIKARIGRLIISNNDFTKKKVIRREAELKRGDPYNLNDIFLAQRKIYRLGYFKKVSIKSISDESAAEKDLLVEVEEKDSGRVEIGVGYATEEKLRGYIMVGHSNIGGYGRFASIKADADKKSKKLTFYFEEPWLFNHPYDATIFISDQYLKAESYSLRKFSTAVGIKRDFTEKVQGVLQYEVEFDKLTNVESEAVLIPEDIGTNRINSISPYVVRDSRDDPFNPSRGSLSSLRLDYADRDIGSQLRFQKLTGRTSHFFPLRKNMTLAVSLRGGYGFSFGAEPELPINKRFFLGGRNTVRGFEPDSIGPKGASDVPIGGNVMVNYNAELRISFGKSWGGIIFYDAGNVWAESDDFKFDEVRDAVGIGFRFITVAGPISLDVGRKLDRRERESLSKWYFTIGNIF